MYNAFDKFIDSYILDPYPDWKCPDWAVRPVVSFYEFNYDEENEMPNLVKKYINKNRNGDEQRAIDEGLLEENGVLTQAGKDLLLQILFEKNKAEFLKETKELTEKEGKK